MDRRPCVALAALAAAGAVAAAGALVARRRAARHRQEEVDAFSRPTRPLPPPGTLMRTAPLGKAIPGATAFRILYVSERPDGTPAATSGMLFLPDAPAPAGGRPVVAWAHPTTGFGDACVPSRAAGFMGIEGWVAQMVGYGWIVVATDYTGMGTPGTPLYLVGASEARDVAWSVAAARQAPGAEAGTRWAVYGHSQGGHAALWTGALAPAVVPDLPLVAVAAAAPASELAALVHQQWDRPVAWVIGPEASVSWAVMDRGLPLAGVLSPAGLRERERIASTCILPAALEGYAREGMGESFFAVDPVADPRWAATLERETPPPLPPGLPVLIGQGLEDKVVLPNTTALLQRRFCAAGADLSMAWLGSVNHLKAGEAVGPLAADFFARAFAGQPAARDCDVPPPVTPYPG